MRENPVFQGQYITWTNACVGDNGSPQMIEYARGFATAAKVVIDEILKCQEIKLRVDELIYPICFNMRHSAELYIKNAIGELVVLYEHRGLEIDFDGRALERSATP